MKEMPPLPPLAQPVAESAGTVRVPIYSVEQIQSYAKDYARLCVQEALEEAARVCEELLAWNMDDPGETAAAAIRKMKDNP